MQASTWGNGQCRQVGQQLQSTQSSHLLNTAMRPHFTMHNGVIQQLYPHPTMSMLRNNLCLSANNGLQTKGHPDYHLNSAQTLSKQSHTPTVNLNTTYCQQVMPAHPVSGKPSLTVQYQQHGTIQSAMNQNTNLQAGSIRAHMTNPTSSSSMQAVYNNIQLQPVTLFYNQVAAQNQRTSQSSQEAASPSLQNNFKNNFVNTDVPIAQNVQVYSVNSVTVSGVSTSSLNLTRDQCERNGNFVPRTNEFYPIHPVNEHESALRHMMTNNNTDNTSNSLTAGPVQTYSYHNQEHSQHLTARGNRDIQTVPNYTTQSAILNANGSCTLNAPNSLVPLPVQSGPNTAFGKSSLQHNRAAPPQTTLSTMNHSVHGSAANLMSCFYQRINKVSRSHGNACASMTQPSQVDRCEVFNKFNVSAVHPNDCSHHTSPGGALRAIAVVPPLSQESCPNNHASNSQPSQKTTPDSFSPCPNQNTVPTQDKVSLKETTQYLNSGNVFTENADSVEDPLKSLLEFAVHGKKDQCLAQVANPSVNLKLSVRGKTPKRKTPTEQNPCEKDILALPTSDCTLEKLYKMIIEIKNTEQQHNSDANYDIAKQMICKFWDGNIKRLISELRNGWYTRLMAYMREFCSEHVKEDTVILSHLTSQSNLPSRYHVLQHEEVYQDTVFYTSSWLNKNSQLDDIDKEFGFPWFLKYQQECGSDLRAPSPSSTIDADTPSNVKDSQSELQPLHSEPEKHITDKDTLKQPASPNDLNAQPCDSSYSFKIEVLSPDMAKVIFDQIQCESTQKVDNSSTEKETTSSENDDELNDTERERCIVSIVEKVCCVEKWKEKVSGFSFKSNCKCHEQTQEEKPLIEEKQAQSQHKNDNDEKFKLFRPATDSTVDLTEDDRTPVIALKEIGDTSIIVISEDEVSNHTDDHEEDFEQALPVSAEGHQISEKMLEMEEDCRMESKETGSETPEGEQTSTPSTPFTSSDELKNSVTKLTVDSENLLLPLHLIKQKLPAHLKSQSILESFAKCKNVATIRTVELVLFGSTQQENCSAASRRSNLPCPDTFSGKRPPRKISVKMSPLKRSRETEPLGDILVKKRIHESWRNSFPPIKIELKRKNKKFSWASPVKTISPTKKKNIVNSKRKFTDANDSQPNKKKRRRGVKKVNRLVNVQVLKKPVYTEIPLQENVLKFNVLPKTFSFKEVSHSGNTTDAAEDKTTVPSDVVDKQHITKTKGAWCEEPSKKNSPLRPASGPETKSFFQEFQKRYKMMTRTDKDE